MATYWENSCSFGLRYVSWYKYLIVSLVFSHLGFWSGNLFLIAPFPDLCLLVPCNIKEKLENQQTNKQISTHILKSSHTVAYNPNARRAYEKSQHAEDFGRIKINLFL